MHLNEDLVVVQKEYITGEERKFIPIITDFRRYTQPIIRYRLNDILTESKYPCSCGSLMTAIESIEGRCDDIFYFAADSGGDLVAVVPDFIRRAVITSSDAILEYQVIQKELDFILVAFSCNDEGTRTTAEKAIRYQLELLCRVKGCVIPQINFSEELPKPSDRKLRRVQSELFILSPCF